MHVRETLPAALYSQSLEGLWQNSHICTSCLLECAELQQYTHNTCQSFAEEILLYTTQLNVTAMPQGEQP